MGASPSSQAHGMSPLTRVKRTDAQGTRRIALMVDPVMITLMFINGFGRERIHFEFEQQKADISERWCRGSNPVDVLVIVFLIHMPRERGKPRRGAAWYALRCSSEETTEI
jgi:hypothetical protein